jgi:hypothetical protein
LRLLTTQLQGGGFQPDGMADLGQLAALQQSDRAKWPANDNFMKLT